MDCSNLNESGDLSKKEGRDVLDGGWRELREGEGGRRGNKGEG